METINIHVMQTNFSASVTGIKVSDFISKDGKINPLPLCSAAIKWIKGRFEIAQQAKALGAGYEKDRIKLGKPAKFVVELVGTDISFNTTIKQFGNVLKNSEESAVASLVSKIVTEDWESNAEFKALSNESKPEPKKTTKSSKK